LALGGSLIYEGFDGCSKVIVVDKSSTSTEVFNFSTVVAGDPNFRYEGLTCDPNTFAPVEVMWSKEAYAPMRAHAYEIPKGSCGFGGEPSSSKGSISGMKFNDSNGNGTRDTGELGLANWTITLKNETGSMSTEITDANGNYIFTNLTDGNYTVREVQQSGWNQTAPVTGNYTVIITGGSIITGKDFGNVQASNKCDKKKHDDDKKKLDDNKKKLDDDNKKLGDDKKKYDDDKKKLDNDIKKKAGSKTIADDKKKYDDDKKKYDDDDKKKYDDDKKKYDDDKKKYDDDKKKYDDNKKKYDDDDKKNKCNYDKKKD
jgi:hypothetical protein